MREDVLLVNKVGREPKKGSILSEDHSIRPLQANKESRKDSGDTKRRRDKAQHEAEEKEEDEERLKGNY